MGTLKPQSNVPLYSNTVIGTLAVDGWAVTFGTTGGCGGFNVPAKGSILVTRWCLRQLRSVTWHKHDYKYSFVSETFVNIRNYGLLIWPVALEVDTASGYLAFEQTGCMLMVQFFVQYIVHVVCWLGKCVRKWFVFIFQTSRRCASYSPVGIPRLVHYDGGKRWNLITVLLIHVIVRHCDVVRDSQYICYMLPASATVSSVSGQLITVQ